VNIPSLVSRNHLEQSSDRTRILLVPIGSFEQHGPHLPFDTDTIIARTVCSDVELVADVDVAPALAYGASGEHQGFAGLLSLGTKVTQEVLVELVRSARDSWAGVIFVSGHGGNNEALANALRTCTSEGDRVFAWMASAMDGDPHAGESETSVMLSIDVTLVRQDLIEDAEPPENWGRLVREQGIIALGPSGVLGSPSKATVERGMALRERWCAEVVTLIKRMRSMQ
jgi:creatinine amidohydrolase